MLTVTLDQSLSIFTLVPGYPLTLHEFLSARSIFNDHVALKRELKGIVIRAESFPNWRSFKTYIRYLSFSEDQHLWVKQIAVVTNSPEDEIKDSLAQHFTAAKVHLFKVDEADRADKWIRSSADSIER